jgi:antitoxin component YwqK of YwqJK toxin-antitoxin module
MKLDYLIVILLLFSSCKQNQVNNSEILSLKIPSLYILKTSKHISINNDTVYLKGEKFSGFLYALHQNKIDTLSVEGYSNGLAMGVTNKWFANKKPMEIRFYKNGAKHGKQLVFWENGNKKFEYTAKNDAYEGEMKEWSVDGKLIHLANYKDGQENGTQKLWYDNGKIKANYVIINGKRYGLLGTKNCKNVSDSIFNFR